LFLVHKTIRSRQTRSASVCFKIAYRDNRIFGIIRFATYHPILLKEDIPVGNKRKNDDLILRLKNTKGTESSAVADRTGFCSDDSMTIFRASLSACLNI
jgi:hypothetical protein